MIYALPQQDLPDTDCLAIARAISDHDRATCNYYVSLGAIIHVMDISESMVLYCVYCRIPVFATAARGPGCSLGIEPWHFEHKETGDQPGQCIGMARNPPTRHALGILNPARHGCYIQMGFETDAHGIPTEWHRTKCKTIELGQTYCHHAAHFGCV